jgi:hypothetical protein
MSVELGLRSMANLPSTKVISVIGGNLFHIAAQHLGSALQWINIAQANGITDPELRGALELKIPAPSAAFSEGVIQQ